MNDLYGYPRCAECQGARLDPNMGFYHYDHCPYVRKERHAKLVASDPRLAYEHEIARRNRTTVREMRARGLMAVYDNGTEGHHFFAEFRWMTRFDHSDVPTTHVIRHDPMAAHAQSLCGAKIQFSGAEQWSSVEVLPYPRCEKCEAEWWRWVEP